MQFEVSFACGIFFAGFAYFMVAAIGTGAATLSLARCKTNPLLMPFAPFSTGGRFSITQLIPMFLGNVMGIAFIVSGYLGAYSNDLIQENLKNMALMFILPFGILASGIHTQMIYDRLMGNQIATTRIILYHCTPAQLLFLSFVLPWVHESSSCTTTIMASVGCGAILLTILLRVVRAIAVKFDSDKYEALYCCPFGGKQYVAV